MPNVPFFKHFGRCNLVWTLENVYLLKEERFESIKKQLKTPEPTIL